jgi:DHA1 family tetracycline resistance protein-like MFS transporter
LRRSPLLPIFLIVLVDLLGFTIVLPLLPFYSEQLGASPFVFGLIVSSYAACQLVAGPILGRLSDRFGRKPLLAISQVGTLIGLLILATANVLWLVFLARIIDGLTAGNLSLAQAYISDVTKPEERTKSFAVIGIAFGIGFAAGPGLAWLFYPYGPRAPIFAAAGLSLLSILCTLFLLPRNPPRPEGMENDTDPPAARLSIFSPGAYLQYFHRPELSGLLWQFAFFTFAFSTFVSGFALFTQVRVHYGAKEVSQIFAYIGVLGIVVQGGLVGRAVKRFGESGLVRFGFAAALVAAIALGFSYKPSPIWLMAGLFTLGTGVLRPALTSIISQVSSRREQGTVLGITQSLQSITQIVAPPLGTALIGWGMPVGWALIAALAALLGLLIPIRNASVAQANRSGMLN